MLHFGHRPTPSFPLDAHALVTTVAWLRPFGALGQALAVAAAAHWLHLAVPMAPLSGGIALLALTSPLLFWRLRQPWPVGQLEACAHLAADILLLGWALYFTGGASNPFITLLLVPVALAAAALPGSAIAGVTALAAATYALLTFAYVPLPDMPMHGNGFRLHLAGMTINFMLAIVLLAVFVGRTSASLGAQREATRRLRERALRDEGILAIATQAADAAHRLNTPLSTLRTLAGELAREHAADAELQRDVRVMAGEIERCRDILRDMVAYGHDQLEGGARATSVPAYIQASVERFQLLQPQAELTTRVDPALSRCTIGVQPGLAHALLNLMQNALDASRAERTQAVTVEARLDGAGVALTISDHGAGLAQDRATGLPLRSAKRDGLGIGLALARSTIERMRGELHAHSDAGGTHVCVRLPLGGNP
jgi:two-component system sensor histidine kinase RegB